MFRNEFLRMYELRDQIKNPDSLNQFWKNLDVNIQNIVWREACRPYEDALKKLDSTAWEFIKKEASVHQNRWDKKKLRGQQPLIDLLNQARAYTYLRGIGCSDIHFIPQSKVKGVKTPDLKGALGEIKVICEVKTINISNDEALRRRRGDTVRNEYIPLEQGFFDKLISDIKEANDQIEAYDIGKQARHIVYIIINFDNFWGEYKEKHFQEIDQYLCENIIHGIEIVFHNQRTAFHRAITMKYATVVNEAYFPETSPSLSHA